MGKSSGVYELNHECARTNTCILLCDKTRVYLFYFDSYTTRPLLCAALFLWKAHPDRLSWLLLWIQVCFHHKHLYN